MAKVDVLLEIGLSKEVTKDTLEVAIRSRLPSASGGSPILLPYDAEKSYGAEKSYDAYILQK